MSRGGYRRTLSNGDALHPVQTSLPGGRSVCVCVCCARSGLLAGWGLVVVEYLGDLTVNVIILFCWRGAKDVVCAGYVDWRCSDASML